MYVQEFKAAPLLDRRKFVSFDGKRKRERERERERKREKVETR